MCPVRYSPVFIQRTQTEKQVLKQVGEAPTSRLDRGDRGIGVRDRGRDRVIGQSPLPWLPSPILAHSMPLFSHSL